MWSKYGHILLDLCAKGTSKYGLPKYVLFLYEFLLGLKAISSHLRSNVKKVIFLS